MCESSLVVKGQFFFPVDCFSSSTFIWVPLIKVMTSGLCGKCLYPQNHLAAPPPNLFLRDLLTEEEGAYLEENENTTTLMKREWRDSWSVK